MKPSDALNKLATHLLGEDWYIVDPVGPDQAAEIILEEICSKYPAVKEDPVDAYRRKYKKCIWCEHLRIHHCFDRFGNVCFVGECSAKDKMVMEDAPHPFCKIFKLKKEAKNEENSHAVQKNI